ncbi:preprotein translocase subunit SecE [[Acholeplasma] multilocale]|uniref:preprotein translocase subunit SecE n=1 Tax=[Acholeplasma] multilocale TaxID=264638 RepID=UPI0012EB1816|nr:preprotein translocase subunit SecE [[Acholeplasma] multilocale]
MSEKISKQAKAEAKAAAKFEKSEAKRLVKLAKKSTEQSTEFNDEQVNSNKKTKQKISKETKQKIKVKKEKEKFNWKLAFKEFPIKMAKEVNKIKWSGSDNLTKKYITVVIFMLIFAVLFYFVDMGLQELFVLIKVI